MQASPRAGISPARPRLVLSMVVAGISLLAALIGGPVVKFGGSEPSPSSSGVVIQQQCIFDEGPSDPLYR